MHTGHSVYSTLHADTCLQTITRLTNPPIDIPDSMLDSVHLNVVMFRDRRRGIRRAYEIGEFVQDTESREGIKFKPSILYRWDPREDKIIPVAEKNIELYEKIGAHTGLNIKEVREDIDTKKRILDWLVNNKIRQAEEVGKIMNRYYRDTETLVEIVNKNKDPAELLE